MRKGGKRYGIEISLKEGLTVGWLLELVGCGVQRIHIGIGVRLDLLTLMPIYVCWMNEWGSGEL